MNDVLKFSVSNIEFMDEVERSLFRKVRIKSFSSGENTNTQPVDENVLVRCAKTVYNKPILWKYNEFLDDAGDHDTEEVPCGFVPMSEENPVVFEKENGKTYITINALLWTKYSGRLIDIFKRDGNKKDVSAEITVFDGRKEEEKSGTKPRIDDFVIAGITLLGENINPACKGCEAELLEFSENKNEYLKESDNNKVEQFSDSEINNGSVGDNEMQDETNNEVVVEEKETENEVVENVTEEKPIEETNTTEEPIVEKDEKVEETEAETETEVVENSDISVVDNAETSVEAEVEIESVENKDIPDTEEETEPVQEVEEKQEEPVAISAEEVSGFKSRIESLEEEVANLKSENQKYSEKIQGMSDYDELKKFKEDVEEKERKAIKMSKINEVMADITSRINLSEEQKETYISKVEEFSSVDAWSNYVKAQMFDNAEYNSNGVLEIGLSYETGNEAKSIWDRF